MSPWSAGFVQQLPRGPSFDNGTATDTFTVHDADRGLTLTVITDAAWQAALERAEGKEAVTFVEAALEAFDVALDLATTAQPLSEAIIRRLHERVTDPQDT